MPDANLNELWISRIAIAATLAVVTVAYIYYMKVFFWGGSSHPMSDLISFFVATPLIYANLVYQASRLGALKRTNAHRQVERDKLEQIYKDSTATLTILIPSYKEEPHILRQTLLSAALVEYPGKRVVVLIDDPPGDHASRAATWSIIQESKQILECEARKFKAERDDYYRRQPLGSREPRVEANRLANLYRELADWYESLADERATRGEFTHANEVFVNHILLGPAVAHRARAAKLLVEPYESVDFEHEYNRLAESLSAEICGFERKTYINLSHTPNKAMNLNAYIGLMGGSFKHVDRPDGLALKKCAKVHADLHISDSEFILTLDADSIVLPDYALRLVEVMQSDARIAVAQTPYSAFPRASTSLERSAGATTDIQYIAHQGSSYFDAAYWVGANALLRVSALQDIRTMALERGHDVPVFIQERTVIEDTGSTIDLIRKGWKIHNYPERLAYSATPPDFGALAIQRRRWSNGGLIILPDLIRYWLARREHRATNVETLVRLHYLISPATCSIAVLILLTCPLEFTFSVVFLPLAAGPYFYIYGRDLIRSGYGWSDLFRVYALNLILLPVNLAGVLLSLRQAATGHKSSFGRTPKVEDRTAVPPLYLGFNALVFLITVFASAYSIASENYARALFPLFNAGFYTYGLIALIGLRATWDDMKLLIPDRLRGRPRLKTAPMPVAVRINTDEKAPRIKRAA